MQIQPNKVKESYIVYR